MLAQKKLKSSGKRASFCETTKKVNKRPREWEKIIANPLSDEGQVLRIYKELLELNNKEINNLIKNEQSLNRYFSKGDIQMANKDA